MKKYLIIINLIFLSITSLANDRDSLWLDATNAYTGSNYETSLRSFKELERLGYESPELFYNIGNTYYKLGNNIAYSILYYERALRLNPSYEDARNNLELAKEMTLDRIDEVPDFVMITWVNNLKRDLSSNMWAYLSIALFAILAALLLLFRYSRVSWIKKMTFVLAILSLFLAILFYSFSISLKNDAQRDNEAIITSPVSSVRSSPNQQGKSLLIIHEGTKVEIIEDLGEWRRVEISDGRQGWILGKELEII